MAEQAEKTEAKTEQSNGDETNAGSHAAVRVAAIAAATGATALAAKKAFSSRGQSGEEGKKRPKPQGSSGGEGPSMVTEMLESGWSAAKDSLMPFAEDAAGAAGEWIARSGPELVSDRLVPRFIRGFERARKSSDDEDAEG